ncbi:hypothetical protein D3C79_798430 [compost metagenome]
MNRVTDDQVHVGKGLLKRFEYRHEGAKGRFNRQGQAGLDAVRQTIRMRLQRQAALQNSLGLHQHLVATGGQRRTAAGPVEQFDAKVGFQVGNGGTDR